MTLLNLDWIGLEDSRLEPYNNYFIFYVNPKFNIPKLMEVFKEQIIKLIEDIGRNYDDLVKNSKVDEES